jgi:predicted Fe-S protein YdhL (DUF1289 family)
MAEDLTSETTKPMDLAGSTKQDKRSLGILVPQRKDTTIASPCIDICYYTKEGICEGCFRNQEEIINWWAWDAPRKIQALRDIQIRKKGGSEFEKLGTLLKEVD